MQLGMIGLGRMGANMVRRLASGGHECVVYDVHAAAIEDLQQQGVAGARSLKDLVARLAKPRAVWLMVPAALVDDGLATGSSMRAAVGAIKRQRPKRLVVAVPVGATATCQELRDEVVAEQCLHRGFQRSRPGRPSSAQLLRWHIG